MHAAPNIIRTTSGLRVTTMGMIRLRLASVAKPAIMEAAISDHRAILQFLAKMSAPKLVKKQSRVIKRIIVRTEFGRVGRTSIVMI